MNRTDEKAQAINLPPVYNHVEKHGAFPEISHDENARFNFLTNLNRHLASVVKPGNKVAFDKRIKPGFQARTGHDFHTQTEIKEAMQQDTYYQMSSALRRAMLEMTQQASRSMVLRQIDNLADKASYYNNQRPETLTLDPDLEIPHYLHVVDYHCLPGSYYTEYIADDVANAATDDASFFVTTAGEFGELSDGSGKALINWLTQNYPEFKPRRILDIGCGTGLNTLPLAIEYPDAEVIGVDVSAPMLRYGHARAVSLGVENVRFIQANAETIPFDNDSFDWVQSTMFLHETSTKAINNIVREVYRILVPGGLMLHVEHAQNTLDMSLFEQFMRDWDTFNNNEPFYRVMHQMDKTEWMKSAGFQSDNLLQFGIHVVNNNNHQLIGDGFQTRQNVFGAWKE
jgi:ubiquinone/menaquinone biosynthesis C-methylase UbiE